MIASKSWRWSTSSAVWHRAAPFRSLGPGGPAIPDPVELHPADIFLSRSDTLLGKLIRVFTRAIGERRTEVNHVGVVVEGGDVEKAVVVEALAFVERHPLWSRFGGSRKHQVAVYRPKAISDADVATIVKSAEDDVGQEYGHLMIAAHLLDRLFLGVYFFRRMVRAEDYPICSWVVAWAYQKTGRGFGVPAAAADPDDIWDYIQSHRDEYDEILPLQHLGSG